MKSSYIYCFVFLGVFIASLTTNWYTELVCICTVTALVMFLDKLGKGIVLREIIALYNVFIYLSVPLFGYIFYMNNSHLSSIFLRYMRVSEEVYFDLALPSISAFVFVLCWPLSQANSDEGASLESTLARAKMMLTDKKAVGVSLLIIGVLISLGITYLPESLQYFFTLFYMSSFAGLLYIYFSESFPLKKVILTGFALFIFLSAIGNGMFTIVVYMGMTIFSFFFIGKKYKLLTKVSIFALLAVVLIVVQTAKPQYRRSVLRYDKENKLGEFFKIAAKQMGDLDNLLQPNSLFFVYYRTNQGFYVTLVQKYIPTVKPHDNGEKVFKVIISAFIPRFLWPDKPKAGGIENMKYYTGLQISGYTTNVGPLGEAYGSFGSKGAIFFMIGLALFIRFSYRMVFYIGRSLPLMIFWIPVLFYEVSYSGENDTLQVLNSIVKAAVFIFIIYRAAPQVFKSRIALT